MSVQGLKNVTAAIKRHKVKSAKGMRTGLYKAALYLQAESQRIVPVDFGILKASARTRMEGRGTDSAAIVSYGTDYAIYVHEDLDARHAPGKTAKFLERPLRENRETIAAIIEREIKKEL